MDFVSDALFDGRRLRTVTIIDAFMREALAIEVDRASKASRSWPCVPQRPRASPRRRYLRVWTYITERQQGAGSAVEPDHWPLCADHPDLLTVAQAAARPGRHVATIARWCRGRGVGKQYGERRRVTIRRLNTIPH